MTTEAPSVAGPVDPPPPPEPAITQTEGYVVLYVVLGVFLLIALINAMARKGTFGERIRDVISPASDNFLAARNSAGPFTIATSLFAGGMGAWIVYGTTELGALPAISWWGVIGYSCGSALPAVVVGVLGPIIRRRTGDRAFSTADFGLNRYGRFMQLFCAAVSCFYMFIYIVAELTSVGNVYGYFVKPAGADDRYTNSITIPMGVITVVYTGIAGLPASILTDKIQGAFILVLIVVVTAAAVSVEENRVSKSEFDRASNSTNAGVQAGFALIIAILGAELFNQATWQRVYAAKDIRSLRIGFVTGALLIAPVMLVFGVFGMLAYAKDPEAYDNFDKLPFLAYFDLLAPLAKGWKVLVLILVTCLCASSVDSLQNALASVVSRDLTMKKLSVNWSRLLVVCLNVPAIAMAADKYDVIQLFVVADLVCCAVAPSLFLGLIETDIHWLLPAPTELGAFLGGIGGLGTIMVLGTPGLYDSGDAYNPYTGELYAKYPWSSFWLVTGDEDRVCALCGEQVIVYFCLTPAFGALFTMLFSKIDLLVRGERARQPIVPRDLFGLFPSEDEPEQAAVDEVRVAPAPAPQSESEMPEDEAPADAVKEPPQRAQPPDEVQAAAVP